MLDQFPQLATTTEASALQCAFLGTSSVVLRDHRTTLLTDGFISRPRLGRVALGGALHPDRPAIAATLAGLGLTEAASIVVTHSHYDHALDAPTVATTLDAELIGSHSTREIVREYDFDLRRYRLARPEKPRSYGDFTISVRESEHSPGDRCPGEISGPLTPPARARQFRTGETYSVHFAHPAGNVIVHGSAGYRPDCLAGLHADVIFVGVGALGRQDAAFRRRYWDETVVAGWGPPRDTGALGPILASADRTNATDAPAVRQLPIHRPVFARSRRERWRRDRHGTGDNVVRSVCAAAVSVSLSVRTPCTESTDERPR